MLYVIEEVDFEPYSREVWCAIAGDQCIDFESADTIVESLEGHYNVKINSIAWCNVIHQTDCDGFVTFTPDLACGITSAIIGTNKLIGVPPKQRNDSTRKHLWGYSMILAEWIHNYKTHDDAINDRDLDRYATSPFKVYRDMSSKRKGKFFEMIVQEYCENMGFTVLPPESSEHDRIIRKAKVEIKGSTLWEGQDELFRWQQIRPAHDYDRMVFLAMYPDRIDLFIAEKDEVNNFVQQQDEDGNFVHNQHGGKTVDSGTFFIQGKPSDFAFMKPLDRYL